MNEMHINAHLHAVSLIQNQVTERHEVLMNNVIINVFSFS